MSTQAQKEFTESAQKVLNEKLVPTLRMKEIELSQIIAKETCEVIEYIFENPENFDDFTSEHTFPGTSDNMGTWRSIAICLAVNELMTGYVKFSQYRSAIKATILDLIKQYFPDSQPYWPNIMEKCYDYIRSTRNDTTAMQEISKMKENIIRVILDHVNDYGLEI